MYRIMYMNSCVLILNEEEVQIVFFDEEELKVAEDLAWKMLDEWNHAYMPNLMNYAHFYYKDQIIFVPWMNEK